MHTIFRRRLMAALAAATLVSAAPLGAQTAATAADGDGQALSLFAPVDGPDNSPAQRPGSGGVPQISGDGPRFQLIGTSRFGDRYRVRLESTGGDVVTVDVPGGEAVALPGYPGFIVEVPEARRVMLRHPDSTLCVSDREEGVECLAGGRQSRLRLASAEPLAPREPASSGESGADGEQQSREDGSDAGQPDNPFARALRAARERSGGEEAAARTRAQRSRQSRRIDPEDVPAGYRVVSTPFGDRLIQE